MLRHTTFTLWSDMKNYLLEYSRILIRLLEMKETLLKNQERCIYKIAYISVAKCPRVQNFFALMLRPITFIKLSNMQII